MTRYNKPKACDWCGEDIPEGDEAVMRKALLMHPECAQAVEVKVATDGTGWEWSPYAMRRGTTELAD